MNASEVAELAGKLVSLRDADLSILLVRLIGQRARIDWREVLVGTITQLQDDVGKSQRERAERLNTILRCVRPTTELVRVVAGEVGRVSGGLQNIIAGHLGAADRLWFQRRMSVSSNGTETVSVVPMSPEAVASPIAVAAESGASSAEASRPSYEEEVQCGTVLLLGNGESVLSDKSLLIAHELSPYVYEMVDRFVDALGVSEDVCACCIDDSILRQLDEAGQRSLLERAARYSNLIHVRIGGAELKLSRIEVREIFREGRLIGDVPAGAFNIASEPLLKEQDIAEFKRCKTLLLSHAQAQFVLGDLSANQARLVVAASCQHFLDLTGQPVRLPVRMETKTLRGGLSGSTVVWVKVTDRFRPVIMKVASKADVTNEIARFKDYIAGIYSEGSPRPYFHGDTALLVFGLVSPPASLETPAATMLELLEKLWERELVASTDGDRQAVTRSADNLAEAMKAGAVILKRINMIDPQQARDPVGNPTLGPYVRLESQGFDAGLGEDAIQARGRAENRLSRLDRRKITHGDVHLGNFLVTGETVPHLIDFASVGPGHPGVDLCRLMVELLVVGFRQVLDGDELVSFLKRLCSDFAALDELRTDFPLIFRSFTNSSVVAGALAARDAGMDCVSHAGGTKDDFLAALFLVAWQIVHKTGVNCGPARAIVRSLASEGFEL